MAGFVINCTDKRGYAPGLLREDIESLTGVPVLATLRKRGIMDTPEVDLTVRNTGGGSQRAVRSVRGVARSMAVAIALAEDGEVDGVERIMYGRGRGGEGPPAGTGPCAGPEAPPVVAPVRQSRLLPPRAAADAANMARSGTRDANEPSDARYVRPAAPAPAAAPSSRDHPAIHRFSRPGRAAAATSQARRSAAGPPAAPTMHTTTGAGAGAGTPPAARRAAASGTAMSTSTPPTATLRWLGTAAAESR